MLTYLIKSGEESMSRKVAMSLHNCVPLDPGASTTCWQTRIHSYNRNYVGEENYCTLIYYERHISAAILLQVGDVSFPRH